MQGEVLRLVLFSIPEEAAAMKELVHRAIERGSGAVWHVRLLGDFTAEFDRLFCELD